MASSRLPLKIAALTSFILLMTVFVAYRSGAFEETPADAGIEQALHEHAEEALASVYMTASDSPPVEIPDSVRIMMLSSKSGFVVDPQPSKVPAQDTQKRNTNSKAADTTKRVPKAFMGGSKSMYIIPADTVKQESPKK